MPPAITIVTPAHGTFTTDATVLVQGKVSNVLQANALVKVNGTVLPVSPGLEFGPTA